MSSNTARAANWSMTSRSDRDNMRRSPYNENMIHRGIVFKVKNKSRVFMNNYHKLLRSIIVMTAITLVMLLFAGCEQPKETTSIELPATSVLSVKSSFGIITSSHLRLRSRPDITADPVTTLWRGYVLEIMSKDNVLVSVENQQNYWYQVNYDGLRGWVFGGYLHLYESRDEAERAARELKG